MDENFNMIIQKCNNLYKNTFKIELNDNNEVFCQSNQQYSTIDIKLNHNDIKIVIDSQYKLERLINMAIVINSKSTITYSKRGIKKYTTNSQTMNLSEKMIYIARCQDSGCRVSYINNPIHTIPFKIYNNNNNICIKPTSNSYKYSPKFNTTELINNKIEKEENKIATAFYNELMDVNTKLEFPDIYKLSDKNLEIFKDNTYIINSVLYNQYVNNNDEFTFKSIDKKCGILFIFSWIFHFFKDNIEDSGDRNIFIQLYGYMYLSFFLDDKSFITNLIPAFNDDKILQINQINQITNEHLKSIPDKYTFVRTLVECIAKENENNENIQGINQNTFYRLLGIKTEQYMKGATYSIYENFLGDNAKKIDKKFHTKFPIEDFNIFFRRYNINHNSIPLFNIYNNLYSENTLILKTNIKQFNMFNRLFVSSVKIYEYNNNNDNLKFILQCIINYICSDTELLKYILKIFYHKENNDNSTLYPIIDEYITRASQLKQQTQNTQQLIQQPIQLPIPKNAIKLLIVNF